MASAIVARTVTHAPRERDVVRRLLRFCAATTADDFWWGAHAPSRIEQYTVVCHARLLSACVSRPQMRALTMGARSIHYNHLLMMMMAVLVTIFHAEHFTAGQLVALPPLQVVARNPIRLYSISNGPPHNMHTRSHKHATRSVNAAGGINTVAISPCHALANLVMRHRHTHLLSPPPPSLAPGPPNKT